jgi:hypothetical protein
LYFLAGFFAVKKNLILEFKFHFTLTPLISIFLKFTIFGCINERRWGYVTEFVSGENAFNLSPSKQLS